MNRSHKKTQAKNRARMWISIHIIAVTSITFAVAAIATIALVNYQMKQKALQDASHMARVILDRNLATHTYFSHDLKPGLFELTDPITSDDYFDPTWMSSTYAVREITKYFKSLAPTDYYYKECAINARSPENEADAYERSFIEELNTDPDLTEHSEIRTLDDEPYFVTLRRGEVMEASCLRCHSTPDQAPEDLVQKYGPEQSFNRQAGEVASAISIRVPLAMAYASVDRISLQLSGGMVLALVALFGTQFWLNKRLLFSPLAIIHDKAIQIANDVEHLGEEIPTHFGGELNELAVAFNQMSVGLRRHKDQLEERAADLQNEIVGRVQAEESLRASSELLNMVFATTHFLLAHMDRDFNFTHVNKAYADAGGNPQDYFIGKNHFDIYPHEENEEIFKRVVETGKPYSVHAKSFDHPEQPERGATYWDWSLIPVQDAQDRVQGLVLSLNDVTEQKLAEENERKALVETLEATRALQESEKRHSVLIAQMLNGFALHEIVCDEMGIPKDYRFIEVNQAFEEMTGLAATKIVGKTTLEVLPQTEAYWIDTYGRVALTGEPIRFENYSRELGKHFQVLAYSPQKGQFATVFTDISERKQAEEGQRKALAEMLETACALRESEERFRSTFEQAAVGITHATPDGQFTLVNRRFCDIAGYTEKEMLALTFQEITHPDDLDNDLEYARQLLAGEISTYSIEKRYIRKVRPGAGERDGSPVWVNVTVSLVRAPSEDGVPLTVRNGHSDGTPLTVRNGHSDGTPLGEPRYFIDVIQDITERKQTEERLRSREQQYRALAENIQDYIMRYDKKHRHIYANAAALRVTGKPVEEYIGKTHREMGFPKDLCALWESAIKRVFESAEPQQEIFEWESIEGRTVFDWRVVPEFAPDGSVATVLGVSRDITEHKQAEEALRKERDRAQRYLDVAGAMFVALDVKGEVTLINQRGSDILGYGREEIIGKNWFDNFLPASIKNQVRTVFDRLMAGEVEQIEYYENSVWTKGGEERIIAWHNTTLKDDKGNVSNTLASGEDITKRVRAEKEVQRRNKELIALNHITATMSQSLDLRQILDAALDVIMQLDMLTAEISAAASSKVLFLNEQTGQLEIVTHRNSLTGCPCLVRPIGLEECTVGEAVQRGEVIILDNMRYDDEQHDHCWPEMDFHKDICLPLKTRGKVVGVIELRMPLKQVIDDSDIRLLTAISDQIGVAIENARLYEQAQRRAVELLALNKASQAVSSSLNLDEVLTIAMTEAREMLNAEAASVLLHDAASDELVFTASAGPGSETLVGTRMAAADGVAGWVLQKAQPVLVRDVSNEPRYYDQIAGLLDMDLHSLLAVPLMYKETVIGVMEAVNKVEQPFDEHDLGLLSTLAGSTAITIENARLYEAEREQRELLEESQAQLIHAAKISALGRLAASIAHEINNPLQGVLGCIMLAEEELAGRSRREKLDSHLEVAANETRRISAIVRRMHDFYRQTREQLQSVQVHNVLESVLALSAKQLQHSGVIVERAWAGRLPAVQANPDHLKQVFLNMVLNAIDAMPQGGALCIRTALEEKKPGLLRIEFSDTGVGMPPEVLDHLFEPFFTTKDHGAGLGLSISYGIIEAHNGQITVSSEDGAGATFVILLPVEEA